MIDTTMKRTRYCGDRYRLVKREAMGRTEYFIMAEGTMLGAPQDSLAVVEANWDAVTGGILPNHI